MRTDPLPSSHRAGRAFISPCACRCSFTAAGDADGRFLMWPLAIDGTQDNNNKFSQKSLDEINGVIAAKGGCFVPCVYKAHVVACQNIARLAHPVPLDITSRAYLQTQPRLACAHTRNLYSTPHRHKGMWKWCAATASKKIRRSATAAVCYSMCQPFSLAALVLARVTMRGCSLCIPILCTLTHLYEFWLYTYALHTCHDPPPPISLTHSSHTRTHTYHKR